jgi:hypothetical protein
MRKITFLAAGFALAPVAWAHHPVEEHSPGHTEVASLHSLKIRSGSFGIAGEKGSFVSTQFKLERAVNPVLELGVVLPIEQVSLDGKGSHLGLGDLELTSKYQIAPGRSAGVVLELPTGDHDHGLGSGHIMVAPYGSGSLQAGEWMIHGTLSAAFAFAGHDHGQANSVPEVNWVSPHTDHELQYHLGAMLPLAGGLYGNFVLAGFTPFERDPVLGGSSFQLKAEAGYRLASGWRFFAGPQLPVGGNRRMDWGFLFGVESSN